MQTVIIRDTGLRQGQLMMIYQKLFAEYNWKYLTYNQVMRMVTSKSVDFSTIEEISKTLED